MLLTNLVLLALIIQSESGSDKSINNEAKVYKWGFEVWHGGHGKGNGRDP